MDIGTYFVVSGTIIALVLLILNFRIFREMIRDMEEVIDQGHARQKTNMAKIDSLQADILRLSMENEQLSATLDSYVTGNQVLMNTIEGCRARLKELERKS